MERDRDSAGSPGSGDQGRHRTTAAGARRAILIYGINYAPELAGVAVYTTDLARYLAEQGGDVTVITAPPHYPGWAMLAGYANRYRQETVDGVRLLRCPLLLRRRMGGIWRLIAPATWALTSAPVFVVQMLRRRPAALVVVEPTLTIAPIALLMAKLLRVPTYLHVQDLEVDAAFAMSHLSAPEKVRSAVLAIEGFLLRRFSAIVTISHRMAALLTSKVRATVLIHIVRNWVDTAQIFPLAHSSYRAELGIPDATLVVLYSGNIGAKQGLHVLLEAAQLLPSDGSIAVIVAGEGPLKATLVADFGHLSHIRFLPFQPIERLNEFLNMADLHAVPQEAQAADLVLPSKLGGILASGKPVVVTADAMSEVATFLGEAAIIVPPGDAGALAQAIRAQIGCDSNNGRTGRLALANSLSRGQALERFSDILQGRKLDRD